MDLAPTALTTSTSLEWIPTNSNPSSLTSNQQTLIRHILWELFDRTYPNSLTNIDATEWVRAANDQSQITTFLLEILGIVKKIPQKTDMQAGADLCVEELIEDCKGKIDAITIKINEWNQTLEEMIDVLSLTSPHPAAYKKKLNDLGSLQSLLFNGDYIKFENKANKLINRVNIRIFSYKKRETSQTSMEFIVNIHDIDINYLNASICHYGERTENLIHKKRILEDKLAEMKKAREAFEYSYCLIDYSLKNCCMCDRKGIFFNAGWNSGFYKIPQFLPNSQLELQIPYPPFIHEPKFPKELTDQQCNYLHQIFGILKRKDTLIQGSEEDLFRVPECQDPLFLNLFKIISLWRPLSKKEKTKQIEDLKAEVAVLGTLIENTSSKFDMWDQQYKLNIGQLTLPLTSNGTDSSVNLGVQPETAPYADLRQNDMQNYAHISANELNNISIKRKELEKKINQRIEKDSRDKIHDVSLTIISNSFDIQKNDLENNVNAYHIETQTLKQLLKSLSDRILQMNETIVKFRHSFDYFCYLYENSLVNSTYNQFYFDGWYALGYFIKIQKGNFKAPPKGVLPPQSTNQAEEKEIIEADRKIETEYSGSDDSIT